MNKNTQALTTVSTRTHGEDAIPLETIGTLDGITTHGEAVTVRLHNGRMEVVTTGKVGQLYVANKPRVTKEAYPKLVVNGKARKNVSYERGAFPSHGPSAPNTAARKIAKATLVDPTITLTTGETITAEGTWTIMAMVKTASTTGVMRRWTVVAKGEGAVVKFVNG